MYTAMKHSLLNFVVLVKSIMNTWTLSQELHGRVTFTVPDLVASEGLPTLYLYILTPRNSCNIAIASNKRWWPGGSECLSLGGLASL